MSRHGTYVRSAVAFGLASLGLMIAAASGQVVLSANFDSGLPAGWGFNTTNGPASLDNTVSYSPSNSIKANGGFVFSSGFTVQPFEHYQINFKGNVQSSGQFGLLDSTSIYKTGPGWLDNEWSFRAEWNKSFGQLGFFSPQSGAANVDNVTVTHITRAQAADALDRFYDDMHQGFNFNVDSNRHEHIQGAIEKLNNGENLRIVMLGDSIVNDTSRGYFEPLIDRMYSGSKTDIITSTRSSTGAWWYEQSDPGTGPRVNSYVNQHNPDVVVIGGISHHDPSLPASNITADINSIRNVMNQVRAAHPDVEFILLSEAAGANQSPTPLGLVNPSGSDYRSLLFQLAEEQDAEFIDMTMAWTNYILESGQPYANYLRDPIHMNTLGSQIMGRAFEAYFKGGLYGDADRDGDVDLSDLSLLAENYGQSSGAIWQDGDFDRDGDVDLNDLSALASKYGGGEAQAFADFQALAVPEPGSASILLAGIIMALARRRSRA